MPRKNDVNVVCVWPHYRESLICVADIIYGLILHEQRPRQGVFSLHMSMHTKYCLELIPFFDCSFEYRHNYIWFQSLFRWIQWPQTRCYVCIKYIQTKP